jgi:hypothetical protein
VKRKKSASDRHYEYYPLSNDENDPREYASGIYEIESGYTFSEPNIGTYNAVTPPIVTSNMVAAIHSHPDLPDSYDYSKKRFGKYIGEYRWISEKNLPIYLITGNGIL